MEVKTASINFTYLKRKYQGQVSMFQPANELILRVYVLLGNEKGEQVFVFYKLKANKLFWHDLQDEWKQGMAKVVAGRLLG